MATADTETTSILPLTQPPRRGGRRGQVAAGIVAGALALGGLGFVLLADGEQRLTTTPAPTTTAVAGDGTVTTNTAAVVPTTTGAVVPTTTRPVVPTTTSPSPPATTTTPVRQERLSAGSRLSLDGIGPVDIGMTIDEASEAAGAPIRILPNPPFNPECHYAEAAGIPEVKFMVINGRIARVDASGRVTTVSGMGKGSTEDAVKQTYPGRIEVQRHPYVPTGRYLVYVPADPDLAHLSMIFETDGRVVTTFRAGMKGAVAQIEGCS